MQFNLIQFPLPIPSVHPFIHTCHPINANHTIPLVSFHLFYPSRTVPFIMYHPSPPPVHPFTIYASPVFLTIRRNTHISHHITATQPLMHQPYFENTHLLSHLLSSFPSVYHARNVLDARGVPALQPTKKQSLKAVRTFPMKNLTVSYPIHPRHKSGNQWWELLR